MKLGDWLEREKITLEDFGLRIRRSHSAVSRYVSGQRLPSKSTMDLIRTETSGEVTPNDFFDGAGPLPPLVDYDNALPPGDPSVAEDDQFPRVAQAPHAA